MMKKILIICGPTATGKTSLGIRLAKKFGGEIVSADSRQVYKGMDVGTGKEIAKIKYQKGKIQIKNKKFAIYRLDDVPVWLWDIVEPNHQFSVAEYVNFASVVIQNIQKRKKLPILVGGAGFYIKAVVDGIGTLGVEPSWGLRKQLSNLAIRQLREILKRTCPERLRGMNESDRNNPRRLIRAIEIAQNLKFNPPASGENLKIDKLLIIGLKAPYKILYQKIDQRVEERVKDGMEEEIKNLLKRGYNFKNSVLGTTIGYQEWRPFFEEKLFRNEVIQKWKFAEHGYARRQMTWFKKDSRINWFNISKPNWQLKVVDFVKNWYYKN